MIWFLLLDRNDTKRSFGAHTSNIPALLKDFHSTSIHHKDAEFW